MKRTLLTCMVTSPLVMPEIITGIAMLFLLITLANFASGVIAAAWLHGRSSKKALNRP